MATSSNSASAKVARWQWWPGDRNQDATYTLMGCSDKRLCKSTDTGSARKKQGAYTHGQLLIEVACSKPALHARHIQGCKWLLNSTHIAMRAQAVSELHGQQADQSHLSSKLCQAIFIKRPMRSEQAGQRPTIHVLHDNCDATLRLKGG